MKIPGLILKQMYTLGSLENVPGGVRFSLKNRLSNATVTRISEVRIDDRPVPLDRLTLSLNGEAITGAQVSADRAIPFPLARVVDIRAETGPLDKGPHEIALAFETTPFGALAFKVKDAIAERVKRTTVPFSKEDNYSPAIVAERQKFAEEYTGVKLHHVNQFSFEAAATRGTSRTSPASPRCRSASPARSRSTASTPRASSSSRWPPPRGRSSPPTTGGSRC